MPDLIQVVRAAPVGPVKVQVTRANSVQVVRAATPAPWVLVQRTGPPGLTGDAAFTGPAATRDAPALGLYFPEVHGAVRDGVTDDATAINAAIAAAVAGGGGTVCYREGTYGVSAPIVPGAGVRNVGVHSSATTIKLLNGANCSVFQSTGLATLVNSNKWLVSDGVPTAFSVEHMRIDGNKANNTTGHGIHFYGKRYRLFDVIVTDAPQIGIYSECAYQGGQTVVDDLPEGDYDQIFVRGSGGDGILYRGPHDAHFGSVFTALNGGRGFATETSNGTGGAYYNGQCDIDFIHSYSNTGDGVQFLSPTSILNLQTESNGQRGLLVSTASSIRIGLLYAYKNWSSLPGAAPQSDANIEITTGGATIGQARIRTDNGGCGLRISSNGGCAIGAVSMDGQSTNGLGLDVQANNVSIGAGVIQNFSAAGGVGFQLADGLNQVQVAAVLLNNATLVNFQGTTGSRHSLDLSGFATTGQVAVAGSLDGTVGVINLQFGGAGTGIVNDQQLAGSGWNTGHPKFGSYHEWYDATGVKRFKSSAPSSDTDGNPISTASVRSQLTGPTGTLAATYLREGVVTSTTAALPASGTVQVAQLAVEKAITTTKVNLRIGTTAGAGTAGNVHQWAAVTDSTGKVVAVTGDQLATALSGQVGWNLTASTTLQPGTYYVHLCIVMNTTMPTVYGRTAVDASAGIAPVLVGTGATGQTTPPALAATLALPSTAASPLPLIWLT